MRNVLGNVYLTENLWYEVRDQLDSGGGGALSQGAGHDGTQPSTSPHPLPSLHMQEAASRNRTYSVELPENGMANLLDSDVSMHVF